MMLVNTPESTALKRKRLVYPTCYTKMRRLRKNMHKITKKSNSFITVVLESFALFQLLWNRSSYLKARAIRVMPVNSSFM